MLQQQVTPDAMMSDLNQPALVQAIRQRVIPQLLKLHAPPGCDDSPLPETLALVEALIAGGQGEAQLAALAARGVPGDVIMLNLLAPAARALNEMWEQDHCSFATVTLAMWRLRGILRGIAEQAPQPVLVAGPERSILVSTLPGEQHDFGAAMVAEFFRNDGWIAQHIRPATPADLVAEVRAMRPALLGLSIARNEALPQLRQAIAAMRRAMRREAPAVIVDGAALSLDPAFGARTGADGWALDARAALGEGLRLVEARAGAFPDASGSHSKGRAGPVTRKERIVGLPNPRWGVSGPGTADHRATARGRG